MQCILEVPADATNLLIVAGEGRNLTEEGHCVWFDESFEHTLLYEHPERSRMALYIDVLHPGLLDEDQRGPPDIEAGPLDVPDFLEKACRWDSKRLLASL
mmetsp:Transcript_184221/g.584094  ORF Transcript_184221/g.584094 Transcript_184221/m.584094 type:complete len:100 (-) Transcript_184221:441-740(-)